MNKELEKVMIEDVEYSFDPEKEYIKRRFNGRFLSAQPL